LKTISGFTFIRNGVSLGYPFVESIKSLLPIVDEFVIALGFGNDETKTILANFKNPKILIIETVWDDNKRIGGTILAEQTDIALKHCKGEWCIYLQADEIIHEDDYQNIIENINNSDQDVEGLIFNWRHFYGSYNYLGVGRQWYRREVRAFKNSGKVVSWKDAQGFRTLDENGNTRKLKCKLIESRIFHYGWVRPPKIQMKKQVAFYKLYHQEDQENESEVYDTEFDYTNCYEVKLFKETHPKIILDRISNDSEWCNKFNPSKLIKKPIKVIS
jgi:glycosyltransferase involved in cell wall biosynthesis